MTVPVDTNPLVRAAINALDAFGAMDRGTANELLTMWARRTQLLDAEVRAVLDFYPPADYCREHDDPTGGTVPEHIEGHPVTGRRTE
jgi:hypothetical protein